jgi:hypothetical protein
VWIAETVAAEGLMADNLKRSPLPSKAEAGTMPGEACYHIDPQASAALRTVCRVTQDGRGLRLCGGCSVGLLGRFRDGSPCA